ncbi:MAG: OmpA family protein [Cyanobacteria bacterium P01_A01_bin.105]
MRYVPFFLTLRPVSLGRLTLRRSICGLGGLAVGLASAAPLWAQAPAPPAQPLAQTLDLSGEPVTYPATERFDMTVNGSGDGPVQADGVLTLREAIELTNGTLLFRELSPQEQQQVLMGGDQSVIGFDLPDGDTTIALVTPLPDLLQPGLVIDGATQPGYDASKSATAEIEIPIPVVELTAEADAEVIRGLTIVADDVTVRGLSIYGFTTDHNATATTPPADIFIAHRLPPPDISEQRIPARFFSFSDENIPPKGIVLEHNWIGMPVSETLPEQPSAFGVSVFNAQGVTIRRNRISYHDGSGIITGARAENTQIVENIVVNNGLAGMPDGIRLEGHIDRSQVTGNLMCGNDGSGIFLFKPEGAIEISRNDIRFNGGRYRRAAVYLMGTDHQVFENNIANQKGPGVVVTAFSQGGVTNSQRNIIVNNQFSNVEGLSIDLNTRHGVGVQDFERGDGPNPVRNSTHRRWETGNSAINAPEFVSPEFYIIDNTILIQGKADPGSEVELYLTMGELGTHGPLNRPLATVPVDEDGNFSYRTADLAPGTRLSATATDPRYGTSEPAMNTVILALGGDTLATEVPVMPVGMPECTTRPAPPAPPAPDPAPPQPLRLEVPRNIHFGLDEDFINADSAFVLDQIAAAMQQYPSLVVDLHGHTDSRASVAYNQDLARRRAENARRYLMRQGIAPERMTLRSFGETELLVTETDRTNLARNRRVEFVFQDVRGLDIDFVNQEGDLQIEP